MQGDEGDFRWAVEAEGNSDRAYSTIDIELELVEAEVSFCVLSAHGGEDEWAEEGHADLSAVGVSSEHEIDEMATGVLDDFVDVVGFVGHEDDGAGGLGGDGQIEVGVAGTGVVDATEPEAVGAAFDGSVLVDEDGDAEAVECSDDDGRAGGDVVVAECGEALGAGEGAEDFGAAMSGVIGDGEGDGAVGDEVSGEEDEVGVEGVDAVDDLLEEVGLGVLVEVYVADLGYAEAVEGGGQVGDGDGAGHDVDLVAGDLAGVEGKCRGSGAGADEEVATGQR